MVAKMNARTLNVVIAVDVDAYGRYLTDPAHKSGSQKEGTTNGKWLLCEAVKIRIIDKGGVMSTLEVVAMRIMALEVTNAIGQTKNKA